VEEEGGERGREEKIGWGGRRERKGGWGGKKISYKGTVCRHILRGALTRSSQNGQIKEEFESAIP